MLSLLVLAVIALVGGAALLWHRRGPGKQVWLMLLLAAVIAGNVAIWTIPDSSGTEPVDATQRCART